MLKIFINIFNNKNLFKTPFGTIKSEVSIFPLIYIFFVNLSRFLPWRVFNGLTIYDTWSKQEYLSEHFQFIFYLSTSLLSFLIILKNKYKLFSLQNVCWILFLIVVFFISFEEISHLNPLQGSFSEIIRMNNFQNEINFHNNNLFQPHLFKAFIFMNLFLGWFGWRYFSMIEAIPNKTFSLYFLFTALAYSISALQPFTTSFFLKNIPLGQENYEFLMAMGLFLHTLKMLKFYLKNSY